MTKQDDLSLNKVCEILGKSKRTVTKYIKKGLLNRRKLRAKRE